MKVLLFIGYEAEFPTKEMQKIMDKSDFPYDRMGEIIDFIEKNAEIVNDFSASTLLGTKKSIGQLYCANANVYACCTYSHKHSFFGTKYPVTTMQIADVDTTRPWCIDIYDGKEYIKYLDYDVVNEDINYCKWRD